MRAPSAHSSNCSAVHTSTISTSGAVPCGALLADDARPRTFPEVDVNALDKLTNHVLRGMAQTGWSSPANARAHARQVTREQDDDGSAEMVAVATIVDGAHELAAQAREEMA